MYILKVKKNSKMKLKYQLAENKAKKSEETVETAPFFVFKGHLQREGWQRAVKGNTSNFVMTGLAVAEKAGD